MIKHDDIKLDNCDQEDIFDLVNVLESSFAIKFNNETFSRVKTFGDLCDVFDRHINFDHQDGCTKQQAFYKIRGAICRAQLMNKHEVSLDSRLRDIFPRKSRIGDIKVFNLELGVKLRILTPPSWLLLTFGAGFLSSLLLFFVDWRIAVAGIILFTVAIKIASVWGKEIELGTVRDLTEMAVLEHYADMRRQKWTINRSEVEATIIELFSRRLSIDRERLSRDAAI